MAKFPAIKQRSADSREFLFDDNQVVDAIGATLQCTCPVARRSEKGRVTCKHIKMIIEENQDNLLLNLTPSQEWQVEFPFMLEGKGRWIHLVIGQVDETGARAVSWEHEVLCYLHVDKMSRFQLRYLIWFNVLNFALEQRCTDCSIPLSFDSQSYRAVADGLNISTTGHCISCDVSSLLPGVEDK